MQTIHGMLFFSLQLHPEVIYTIADFQISSVSMIHPCIICAVTILQISSRSLARKTGAN